MRLLLTGRHVEITPALRRLVEQRLAKLGRLLNDGIVSAQVVLTLERYRHLVEITLHARGDHRLHGVGDTTAWETSLSEAIEKLAGQIEKVKGKWEQRKRQSRAIRRSPVTGTPIEEPQARRIVRAAPYSLKPITVDEAAMSMEDGRHEFVVFRNALTDGVNVLYRRKDGNLGLIEPES